jgi:hypothetical protein
MVGLQVIFVPRTGQNRYFLECIAALRSYSKSILTPYGFFGDLRFQHGG